MGFYIATLGYIEPIFVVVVAINYMYSGATEHYVVIIGYVSPSSLWACKMSILKTIIVFQLSWQWNPCE